MYKFLLTFVFLLLIGYCYSQQGGSIKGQIKDAEMFEEPLLFAQVVLENSTQAAQTNFHGIFEFIEVPEGHHILRISYPGYKTLKIPVQVKNNQITKVDQSLKARTLDISSLLESDASATNLYNQPEKAEEGK